MITELAIEETARLDECETVIERGLQTFYEVGVALLTIRDHRLYRASHGTFEEYCRERWSMTRIHANRLVQAAEIADNLKPIGSKPTHESQVRPLAGLEPEDQRTVWEQAVAESDGAQPTAAKVDEVKMTLLDIIEQRRRLYNERRAFAVACAAKEAMTEAIEAPMTRTELAAYRAEAQRNSELNHQVFTFRGAIECFSHPSIDLEYVALELAATDKQRDWRGQTREAENNMKRLRTLLLEEMK